LIAALAAAVWPDVVRAQTFDEANSAVVTANCNSPSLDSGSDLATACANGGISGSNEANVSGGGAFSIAQVSEEEIQKRLIREEAETGRGGSADTMETGLGGGFAAFLSAGAFSLNHDSNRFEDGYASTIPTVTAGIEYRADYPFVVGLAFNYFHWEGDYTDGGDFDANGYGPRVYLGFRPIDNGFVNLVLGYTRVNKSNDREAFGVADSGSVMARGRASGDVDSNQYLANLSTGYDFPMGNFSIGPRVGLNVVGYEIEDYREGGRTGLQLEYDSYSQTSIQTSVGASASYAIPMSFGAIVPRIFGAWVHEFANDSETIDARLVQGVSGIDRLQFETERPDRNWASFGASVTAVLPGPFQPFATFSAIAGNSNYESFGGTGGFYVTW
jgi:outer membrane autotransporter protein